MNGKMIAACSVVIMAMMAFGWSFTSQEQRVLSVDNGGATGHYTFTNQNLVDPSYFVQTTNNPFSLGEATSRPVKITTTVIVTNPPFDPKWKPKASTNARTWGKHVTNMTTEELFSVAPPFLHVNEVPSTNGITFFGDRHSNGGTYPSGTKAPDWASLKMRHDEPPPISTWTNSEGIVTHYTNWMRVNYDTTKYCSVTWDSKTNLFINGIDVRKFMALVKEFSAPPNPWSKYSIPGNVIASPGYMGGYISDGTWNGKFWNGNGFSDALPKTPKQLRDEADAIEEADRQRAIATAKAQKESEERNARWQEYQTMIQKWDEVVK